MSERLVQTIYLVSASFIIGGAMQYIYKNVFPDKEKDDEQELIRKYLLNTSTLYGQNKPKLWVFLEHERNARDWIRSTFRTSTRLNKGYLYASISSITQHCSDDFHICLIDKSAFPHFIPGYDDARVPDIHKKDYGLAQLLYYYGGLVIPASFICHQSLLPLVQSIKKEAMPFFGEIWGTHRGAPVHESRSTASPLFMGAPKHHPVIKELMASFLPTSQRTTAPIVHPNIWCQDAVLQQRARIIPGQWIGTRDEKGERIQTADLFFQRPIRLVPECLGVLYIESEISRIPKYDEWIRMTEEAVVRDPSAMGDLFRRSMIPTSSTPVSDLITGTGDGLQ